MHHKIWLCLLALYLPFTSEAKIVETQHIADVVPLVDADTWFLVDLDNTMFEAKQALGHANWFYDRMQECLKNGMSRDAAIAVLYPDWIKTQKICDVKALESDFVPSMVAMQNQGIVVMGFTARQPSVADSTLRQIASLGFDFTKTAPSKETFTIPPRMPTLYTGGVLFVSDYNKKSDVLNAFLKIINKTPKKIVFIDDKRKNLEEMEVEFNKQGVDYIGVFYTAIDHENPPVYSRELADFQYKYLDSIMSNEAAALLMQSGVK